MRNHVEAGKVILIINHYKCLKWSSFCFKHKLTLAWKFLSKLASISNNTSWNAEQILFFILFGVVRRVRYISDFMYPHKKKSSFVRSSDLAGQLTVPPRSIHLFGIIFWKFSEEFTIMSRSSMVSKPHYLKFCYGISIKRWSNSSLTKCR